MFTSRLLRLSLVGLIGSCSAVFAATPRLKVSDYHQFLVTETGAPFFWLGDTAWELFYRLNREDATRCLENRAKLGFNVVQAVAIAELNGHSDPNPYGFLPLTDLDPAQPAVKDGPNNDCWDHVDFIVGMANELGITDGFLPTWGRYWHDKTKDGKPLFTPANAEVYGEWLGKRYKDAGLVWILGMKTEDKGTKGRTLAGGRSEVLGAHNYNTSGVRDDTPYFEVLDATMSCATYREVCFVGGWWKVPVLAKFGDKEFRQPKADWNNWALLRTGP